MSVDGEAQTYWQSLAVAADQGSLYLDPETAQACSNACNDYIGKLINHKEQAKELANADGWGEFAMGQQFRQILRDKAVNGENNLVDVLESHLQVVREMQMVFNKFFTTAEAVDQDNASGLGQLGPK